jgi:hypothetical protein
LIPRPAILALPALLALGACSLRTGERMYQQPDPVPFTVATSNPPSGATGVPLGSEITIDFSDFPDPASLSIGALSLRSGAVSFDYAGSVDLLHQRIRMRPRTPLTPMTTYTVAMPSDKAGGETLRSLRHLPLTENLAATDQHVVVITFTTGATPGGGPEPPPVVSIRQLETLLQPGCSSESCHDGSSQAARLDLATEDSSYRSLLAPSTEIRTIARVKPGAPAESYLLRKLLGTPDILDDAMPQGQAQWAPEKLQLVSDWIEGGAIP